MEQHQYHLAHAEINRVHNKIVNKGIYNLIERAHAAIKEACPDTDDEHTLKIVDPWFAGILFSDKILKSRFGLDGGRSSSASGRRSTSG